MYQIYWGSVEQANKWLEENRDKEIVDFKFAVSKEDFDNDNVLVVYKV